MVPFTRTRTLCNQITEHYQKLYKPKFNFKDRIDSFLHFTEGLEIPQIKESDKLECEERITLTELGEAIHELNDNSAPGHDGLTPSFYKFFWPNIAPTLSASFMKAFEVDQLSVSQRRAIIIQIHKGKNLPRDQLDNWRPISLTNSDYKILA